MCKAPTPPNPTNLLGGLPNPAPSVGVPGIIAPKAVQNVTPNPVPSLGAPGVLPSSLNKPPAKVMNPFNFGGIPGMMQTSLGNVGAVSQQAQIDAATPTLLKLLGRGTLDTTILGQNRSIASAARYNTNALGG